MMSNEQRLNAAVAIALMDVKFMGDSNKVNKAIEALKPKSTLSATFKRLQGIANKDYLDKNDQGLAGYTEANRKVRIKEYVHDKFKLYMVDVKTSAEATKLFDAAYPAGTTPPIGLIPTVGVADEKEKAA